MADLKIFILAIILLFTGCGENTKQYREKSEPVNDTTSLKTQTETIDNFIFVGMIEYKAGLYKYDFAKKKYSQFWSNYNEQVVELSYSPDKKKAFFLTAGHFGKKNIFPYITRVKLYEINIDSSKVKFIKRIGNGIQVFSQWEDNNNFKIVINRIDKIVATYIRQQTFIYNIFGKELLNETEIFDLTKNGYPRPSHNPDNLNSPSRRFTLLNKGKDSTQVYLQDHEKGEQYYILGNGQKINKFRWSEDERYLILSTIDLNVDNNTLKAKVPETSTLIIYDINEHKIVKQWSGDGVKNFYIRNDFLIFDNGFKQNSRVDIFNLGKMKQFDEIKIKRGCGLRNIPEIPNYRS
ncbi:MAG: hypothetical protein WB996_13960 [Ignavibacteriaceae bacterium]